jgi:hypothetical protein
MKNLSKEKRLQLVLVGLLTGGAIAGLWFGLIAMQESKIKEIAQKKQSVQKEIDKVQKVKVGSSDLEKELKEATNRLAQIEEGMPSANGDLFSWIVSSIKQFNAPSYKVDMPQFSAPAVGEVHMFSSFPYNQAVVTVGGTAYYFEFGKFLADLENHFPYVRVQNLNLEPGFAANTAGDEREKLSFRMEIVTLVKSGQPVTITRQ